MKIPVGLLYSPVFVSIVRNERVSLNVSRVDGCLTANADVVSEIQHKCAYNY